MKKTIIAVLVLLSAGLVQAEEKRVIEGSIAVMPFPPGYAGQRKVDFEGKVDIRDLLNDRSIQSNDLLQEVWAWKGDNPATRFSSNPGQVNNKTFPRHLPYNYLKDLKEDDILEITIDGNHYRLKAHQYGIKYHHPTQGGAGSFEKTLAKYKSIFDKNPNFFGDDKAYLLKKHILCKPFFGRITHGSNTIPFLKDKDGKKAGVFSQFLYRLRKVLNQGL